MGTPAIGALSQFGVDASSSTSTELYEFQSEGMRAQKTILDTNGIRGSRSHAAERTRASIYTVGGSFVGEPVPTDLRKWLPRILGTAESGSGPYAYTVANTLPTFVVSVDKVTKVMSYTGCKVSRATFSSQQGDYLRMSLDIEGLTESVGNAGTFASLSLNSGAPWLHTDLALTILAGARPVREFSFSVDNGLILDRFNNSTTRTSIPESDRNVTLRALVPYTPGSTTTGEADLYDMTAAVSTTDHQVTAVYTNGVFILTVTFGAVQFPSVTPTINSKGETMLELNGVARSIGSTKEIAVALALA